MVFTATPTERWLSLMTGSFLALMPLATGFITSFLAAKSTSQSGPKLWLGLPVLITILFLAGATTFLWEGWICMVMYLPLGLAMSILGASLGVYSARRYPRNTLLSIGLLPFIVSPIEQIIGPTQDLRVVETSTDIAASPATIWNNIKRVAPIQPREEQYSWTQSIGFPRPIEATLSFECLSAVREATFAGGVLFIETVTAWEPEKRLSFHIRADKIPAQTLDDHVTIGGPYFDVLQGEYRLEPLPNGRVRLHLSSRHRLSTTFNAYGRLWTDAVMKDIQKNVLHVVRNRSELTP